MRLVASALAASVAFALSGCDRDRGAKPEPPVPLPTADASNLLCGGTIPRRVAEVIAGTTDVVDNGRLFKVTDPAAKRVSGGSCTVYRSTGKGERVFVVSVQSYEKGQDAARMARSFVDGYGAAGTRLPRSDGYGSVRAGDHGTKVRDAYGVTSSGTVVIDAAIDDDAKGRDPVADMRALLNLVGPKMAPDWPTPPPGTGDATSG